jgi:hypothetical protein
MSLRHGLKPCPSSKVFPTLSRGGAKGNGRSALVSLPYEKLVGTPPVTSSSVFVSQLQLRHLGVGGSGGLLVPIGLAALLDLFVLLFLGVVQDRLYATVTILTDAVHLCLSIAGSERGVGA